MSYERLKMDGWIKSYHRSTVFVCLTGNCIPNRFFTGIGRGPPYVRPYHVEIYRLLVYCCTHSGRPLSCSKTSVQRTITLVFVILASLSMKTSVVVRCVPVFNFWERASEACSFSQNWKRGRFGSLSSTHAT
jgi:hypothetical protein